MINQLKQTLLSTSVFEDNDYLDKYIELIISNLGTKQQKFLTQKHHIIPRCYFKIFSIEVDNSKTNLVNLYHRDHVLAHYYICLATNNFLFKYYNELTIEKCLNFRDFKTQDTYLDDKNFIECLQEYQILKEEAARTRGDILRGKTRDPSIVAQISASLKKVEHTAEWNKKISDSLRGRKTPSYIIDKIKKAHEGRISIVKGDDQRYIYIDDLETYLAEGWIQRGRIGREPWNKNKTKDNDARIAAAAEHMQGHRWTDEQRNRRSKEGNPMFGKHHSQETLTQIQKTKKERGTNIPSPRTRNKISKTLTGYVKMTNGEIEKHAYPHQVDELLAQGFYFGPKPKKNTRYWRNSD